MNGAHSEIHTKHVVSRSSAEEDDLIIMDLMIRRSVHNFLSDLDETWYVGRGR